MERFKDGGAVMATGPHLARDGARPVGAFAPSCLLSVDIRKVCVGVPEVAWSDPGLTPERTAKGVKPLNHQEYAREAEEAEDRPTEAVAYAPASARRFHVASLQHWLDLCA
jgi:hypothetical protein